MTSFKRMRPLLGTYIEIGSDDESTQVGKAVSAAFKTIEQIQGLLSFHHPTSELTRLNQSNGRPLTVQPHTLRVIKLARAMTEASNGLFNCTVGGEMVKQAVLPNHGGTTAPSAGYASDIAIIGNEVQLKRGIKITLDGIAKGYAVDCAISTLKRLGLKSAWVNAGGDIRIFGNKVLPICRREVNGQYVALGGLQCAAVATSIVKEEHDINLPGRIVSNIAKPMLGAWTVMAHAAWRADALTKVACLADVNKRDAIIAALGGVMVNPQPSWLIR